MANDMDFEARQTAARLLAHVRNDSRRSTNPFTPDQEVRVARDAARKNCSDMVLDGEFTDARRYALAADHLDRLIGRVHQIVLGVAS